ncbi:MAG: Txe/YoeB family addiction module toxin [Synergistaceae bacterium]|nr:Txe/YoeB family addiction module toxin [Synergistaceae bacterium]
MYLVKLTKQAEKDMKLLKRANLENKAKTLLNIIRVNPFQNPPPYEKLLWDLRGGFSRRINLQHRLVYEIYENSEKLLSPDGTVYEGIIKVIRMWTHYE